MRTDEQIGAEAAYQVAVADQRAVPRHDFRIGEVVYHRRQRLGKLRVVDVAGNEVYVRGWSVGRGWCRYQMLSRAGGLAGTVASNMDDVELRQELYLIECNVQPPDIGDEDAWESYEARQDSYAALYVEQLERRRDGGIWAMED